MLSNQLVQFTSLKMKIYNAAADALDAANPEYVEAFHQRLQETNGDLQRVIDETRPLIKDGPEDWFEILTALLDAELVIEKVRRSLLYLQTDSSEEASDAGARVVYHYDHWVFQVDALLNRVDRLIVTIFRILARPGKVNGWHSDQEKLRKSLRGLKPGIAKIRNPLAHVLGGGATALQEQHLWEPFLAGRLFDLDLGATGYREANSKRATWHSRLSTATDMAFTKIDQISDELSRFIPHS